MNQRIFEEGVDFRVSSSREITTESKEYWEAQVASLIDSYPKYAKWLPSVATEQVATLSSYLQYEIRFFQRDRFIWMLQELLSKSEASIANMDMDSVGAFQKCWQFFSDVPLIINLDEAKISIDLDPKELRLARAILELAQHRIDPQNHKRRENPKIVLETELQQLQQEFQKLTLVQQAEVVRLLGQLRLAAGSDVKVFASRALSGLPFIDQLVLSIVELRNVTFHNETQDHTGYRRRYDEDGEESRVIEEFRLPLPYRKPATFQVGFSYGEPSQQNFWNTIIESLKKMYEQNLKEQPLDEKILTEEIIAVAEDKTLFSFGDFLRSLDAFVNGESVVLENTIDDADDDTVPRKLVKIFERYGMGTVKRNKKSGQDELFCQNPQREKMNRSFWDRVVIHVLEEVEKHDASHFSDEKKKQYFSFVEKEGKKLVENLGILSRIWSVDIGTMRAVLRGMFMPMTEVDESGQLYSNFREILEEYPSDDGDLSDRDVSMAVLAIVNEVKDGVLQESLNRWGFSPLSVRINRFESYALTDFGKEFLIRFSNAVLEELSSFKKVNYK